MIKNKFLMLKHFGQNKNAMYGLIVGATAVVAGSTAFYLYKRNQQKNDDEVKNTKLCLDILE